MKKNIYILLLLPFFFFSCQSLDLDPTGDMNEKNMWKTAYSAELGVTGIYSLFLKDVGGWGLGEYFKMEGLAMTSDCRDQDYSLLAGNAETKDGLFESYWQNYYEGIARANDAIENLPSAPLSPEKLDQLLSEAKFLRAYFYYKLNALFKGVPYYDLVLRDHTKATNALETEEKIWEYVIKDLTDCINAKSFPASVMLYLN